MLTVLTVVINSAVKQKRYYRCSLLVSYCMSNPDGRHLSIETQNYLRQQAIRLRQQDRPVGEIADYLGVNRSVIGKW